MLLNIFHGRDRLAVAVVQEYARAVGARTKMGSRQSVGPCVKVIVIRGRKAPTLLNVQKDDSPGRKTFLTGEFAGVLAIGGTFLFRVRGGFQMAAFRTAEKYDETKTLRLQQGPLAGPIVVFFPGGGLSQ